MKSRDDFAFYFDGLDETLYIFGGFQSGYKSNDLWEYSVRENKWINLDQGDYCGPEYKEQEQVYEITDTEPISPDSVPIKTFMPLIKVPINTDGKKRPSQRIGSRLVYFRKSESLYVHGGMDNKNEPLNDLWKFDIKTNNWS